MPIVENQRHNFFSAFHLRLRLLRRVFYRIWRYAAFSEAKRLIQEVHYESPDKTSLFTPAIVLSTFSSLNDFYVLSYLFRDKELTFLSPQYLPKNKYIERLTALNFILEFDEHQLGFSFFRKILIVLRDFNRSIAISPEAARIYIGNVPIDPAVVAKIAAKANVPIIPVVIRWRDKKNGFEERQKCIVHMGKKYYISPRTPEFKDVFFSLRGSRQFKKLTRDQYSKIGQRIFSRLDTLDKDNGSNLSDKMEAKTI